MTQATIDVRKNIYLGDYTTIRMIGTDGIINTIAGKLTCFCHCQQTILPLFCFVGVPGAQGYAGDGGEATSAQLFNPGQMCVVDNKVYFPEAQNSVVRVITGDFTASATSTKPTVNPTTIPTAAFSSVPSLTPSLVPSTRQPSTRRPTTFQPSHRVRTAHPTNDDDDRVDDDWYYDGEKSRFFADSSNDIFSCFFQSMMTVREFFLTYFN